MYWFPANQWLLIKNRGWYYKQIKVHPNDTASFRLPNSSNQEALIERLIYYTEMA